MELVDTHCHLHFKSFDANRGEVLAESVKAGVSRLICVGVSLDDSRRAIDYAAGQTGAWATAGAHPHEAAEFLNDQQAVAKLKAMLAEAKVVAAGEIGLDYYKSQVPREVQQKAFRTQLELAIPTGLPFSFHVRDAWSDFWRILDDYPGLKGVVHSFSSGRKQLDRALERGLYVGLNGIMTFTKDQAQLEAAKQVPLERLLLETDAPFLAPVPVRGQTCEPKHTLNVAEFLADLRGDELTVLGRATTDNAIKLFGL